MAADAPPPVAEATRPRPFPVKDIYSLATAELLLGLAQPAERAQRAGQAAQEGDDSNTASAAAFEQVHTRRAWGLVVVVLLVFTIQCTLMLLLWTLLARTNFPSRDARMNGMGTSITVGVVLALINEFVGRQSLPAYLLVRIALTHTGCLPAYFTPLSLVVLRPAVRVARGAPAAALVALPLMQLLPAFAALMVSAKILQLAAETGPVYIVAISAAMVFVLELDNAACFMIQARPCAFGLGSPSTRGLELAERPVVPGPASDG